MESIGPRLTLVLMGVIGPLWLAVGFADWACHRVLHIERTAGLRESSLHLLMLAELGVAVFAALFLELTAACFVLLFAACLAHEVTTWADLSLAESRRGIPWYEQWVHGLQQSLPWVALGTLALVSWPQALAAVGLGSAEPRWDLVLKDDPLPRWYVTAFLGAALVLLVGPFAAEWWRARQTVRAVPDR